MQQKKEYGIAYVLKDAAEKALANNEVYEVELPNDIKLPDASLYLVYLKGQLTQVDKEFIKKYILEKDVI